MTTTSTQEPEADLVRSLWIEHMSVVLRKQYHPAAIWDGKQTPYGRKQEAVWPKVVTFARTNGLDITTLLSAFFHYRDPTRPPTPNLLYSEDALNCYRRYLHEIADDISRRTRAQAAELASALEFARYLFPNDESTALRYTLVDRTRSFTPLFRHCVAQHNGFPDLASTWLGPAAQEYRLHRPIYDQVLGDEFLTEDVRAAAAAPR